MSRVRVAVLISGRGSNMQALIEAAKDPTYPAGIVLALSNRPEAPGLQIARAAGVEALAVDHQPYGKGVEAREAHERVMDAELRARAIDLVCLAGYMRVLTPWFVNAWAGRMLNIHPSLLPHFPGLDTHRRAIEAGHAEHGCTVHLVTEGVDEGPVLGQARVPVLPGDTEDALAARVIAAEHVLYPDTLARYVREHARHSTEGRP